MESNELQRQNDELLTAAMQNAGVKTAMAVFQSSQLAMSSHSQSVYASTVYGQSVTAASSNPSTVR